MAIFPFASCKNAEEIPYTPPTVDRYENHIEIEGQWGASVNTGADGQYGIGDPFVMRYNGKYYLYPSTSDPCDGIKVFESEDLVHWTYKGFAVAESEKTTHGAYAPEVVYYNGYFYLCQSRAGNGHYIYRSESPTEGFELVSRSSANEGDIDYGNIGLGIDGAFHVSDDGRLYLMHTATPAGLKYNEITDVNRICPETLGAAKTLGDSYLGGWIEGPGTFRRGDFSYLTYTGNHVNSKGYRVGYSYAENPSDLSSFRQPADNVTLIDTDPDHYGLGHSSNVNGPDLDSVYTAYHSLVGRGPARRYNVDRYFASGSVLTANGATHRSVAMPEAADFSGYAEKLKPTDGVYSIGGSEGYFTAEYNFVPTNGQELVFGDCRISFGGGKAFLMRDGNVLGQAQVALPEGRLVCVRVENGDGVGHVYVNGMRKITYEAQKTAGVVGYTKIEGVGFTALSNDVFGTSDFEAFKNFPAKFPAISYLKGEDRGFSIRKAKQTKGGVRVGERESAVRIGDTFAVSLKQNDWVKYAIDVPEEGAYAIAAELGKESSGAQIRITIGDARCVATVPELKEETTKVYLGTLGIKSGVQTMKVECVSRSAQIILFDVVAQAASKQSDVGFSEAIGNDGSAPPHVSLIENTNRVNYEATIDFACAATLNTDFGFMIRASHYSYYGSQPAQSWRGYYLQLTPGLIALRRYDYGDTGTLALARTGSVDLTNGASHTVVIRAEGHKFTVTIDGTVTLTAEDACAFFGGNLGIYVAKGNLSIDSIEYEVI